LENHSPVFSLMKTGIILDNPRRELDGALLVAHHLVRRGHVVYVVPMYQQGYDVPWLDLDVIIVNYARLNNRDFLASCKQLGIKVVVLDNEGSVVPEEGVKTPYGPDAISANDLGQYIDHYLFWGERQYGTFHQRSPISPERLHVTGCPRYDFCHPRWRSALHSPWRDYVLINTNFSAVNPQFTRTAEKELEQFMSVGWGEEETRAHFRKTTKLFESYLGELRELAQKNPGKNFLVRPHPFENHAVYENYFQDCPNVRVDGSGSVMAMIHNSTCTLHLNCQTAVETLMMGKLPVSIEYLNSDDARRRYPLPSDISYPAGSIEELNDIIRAPEQYARGFPAAELYNRHVAPLFYKNDGQAGMRVADIVERAGRRGTRASGRLVRSLKGSFTKVTAGRLLQGVLSNMAGSRCVSAFRTRLNPRRNVKYSTLDDIRARFGTIANADSCPTEVRIDHARHPVSRLPMASVELKPIKRMNEKHEN
jgi:surface carbohydrate biosynthesis protein